MVTPAAGPVIVCVSPVFFSSSWLPLSVIVWGVLKTVESKLICAFPVDSALARSMASGRLRRPAPGKSEAARRIHDQIGEDRAGVGQVEGR